MRELAAYWACGVLAAAAAAAAAGSFRSLQPFMTESATAHAAIAAGTPSSPPHMPPAESARRQAKCSRVTAAAAEAGR